MSKVRKPEERKRRNSEDVRADILSQAIRLFAEHGYAAVTVRDISKASKVPMSGIYRYFKDKEQLHTECELMAFEEAGRRVYEGINEDLKPEELIFSITKNLCSIHSSNEDVAILLLRLMQERDTGILKRISDVVISGPSEKLLEKIAKFPSKRSPIQNLYTIFAMSFGFAKLDFLRENLHWSLEEFNTPNQIAVFILDTLFPRKDWSSFVR